MDINDIREYIKKSINVIEEIHNLMEYRNLRTKQAYYSKLCYEYDHDEFVRPCKTVREAGEMDRSYWKTQLISLDKARRDTHNKALTSFLNIISLGELNNLPNLYIGDTLTKQEIFNHNGNLNVRMEMTDAMFEMLKTIEDSVIEQEQEKEEQEQNANNEIQGIQKSMDTFNDQYGVKKSMTKDESNEKDGGVVFGRDLKLMFNNIFDN